MFCSNCGKELPNDAVFCNRCGQSVKKATPISEPEPAIEPEPEPVFEPEPAIEPEPEPAFAPESAPAYEPEPAFEPEPAPAYEPEPTFAPEPAPAYEPEPVFEPEPEPAAAPVVPPTPAGAGFNRPVGGSRVIHSAKRTAAPEPPYNPNTEPKRKAPPAYEPEYFEEPEFSQENRPLSPWAYFGYGILFSIPVVGFILLIVFSFAGQNVNRKNFARSYWCKLIVVLAIVIILLVLVLTGVIKGPIETAINWMRDTGLNWLSGVFG